jgi:ribosome modulation factor
LHIGKCYNLRVKSEDTCPYTRREATKRHLYFWI